MNDSDIKDRIKIRNQTALISTPTGCSSCLLFRRRQRRPDSSVSADSRHYSTSDPATNKQYGTGDFGVPGFHPSKLVDGNVYISSRMIIIDVNVDITGIYRNPHIGI